jgi:hypothetical protein
MVMFWAISFITITNKAGSILEYKISGADLCNMHEDGAKAKVSSTDMETKARTSKFE